MAEFEAIGTMTESTKEFNRCAVVIANSEATIRLSLNRPEDVTALEPLPCEFEIGAIAVAVYRKSIFVSGLGYKCRDIWRLDATSAKWSKCASLVKGRRYHSVAFDGQELYVCGGWLDPEGRALDDVERLNANGSTCSEVGKLAYAVYKSGNCVPVKTSLYIFGGADSSGRDISNVQVYDTKLNTCTLLTKQMPRSCTWLRGKLWYNSVILLGNDGCFVYDIDTQTWKERDKFKFEYYDDFGVIVNGDKLYVIGCGSKNEAVRCIPIANILNDEFIEWEHPAKLPYNFREMLFAVGKVENP